MESIVRLFWFVKTLLPTSEVYVHAVQSLVLKFTGGVQIRCTSGQVRVQNLCKQIED